MGGYGWRGRLGPAVPVAPGARVDRFEIFFDLVFVFSFFIITRATAAEMSGGPCCTPLLVLAVLWWCWVVHSVVATRLRLGEGFVPVLMVVGMAALFTFALALPQAFGDPRGNAAGPIVVGGQLRGAPGRAPAALRHARGRPDGPAATVPVPARR